MQLAAPSGRVCSTTPLAVLIPQEDALCACGWMGLSLLEYFHVLVGMYQHRVGSLELHSEPSHPAPYPFHIPNHLQSQLCSKQQEPGIAACSSLSSTPSHISSKALVPVSELLLQTWACQDAVVSPEWCWVTL